jgi:peptide/nickel transport system substrate-binding protein
MVEVKTRQPMAILLNKLRFILIVPDHVATGWLASHVSGTGPYRLAEFQSMTSLSLTRHEGYWGDRPFLSKVTFRLARSPEQALEDLEKGVSGMAQASRRDVAEKLSKRSDFTVHYRSSIFLKFLGYNTTVASLPGGRKNPLMDVRVRKAIHLAIDRPRLVAGLPSAAVPASQFVPPFIFGFSSSLAVPEWNLSAAKELLAEAGYPDGFEAPLVVRRLFSDAAPSLVSMLFEAGIRLKVESLPDPEFFVRIKHDPAVLHISRFGCPTGDASDIFDNTVHSFDPARHLGSENEGRYANPALDRIIEDSAGMLDMGSRRSALQEIMTEAMRDLPVIPLYIDEDIYAMKSRLVWQPRNDNFILASEISLR